MSNEWINNYNELKEFIAGHPEIRIEPFLIAIPGEIRPEFYRLFGAVLATYVNSELPGIITDANELGTEFAKVRGETISFLNLIGIDFEANVRMFLENPSERLSADLIEPLFSALKGNSDTAAFDRTSMQNANKTFKRYFHLGYEYWAAMSLMCLLAPDQAYTVPVIDQDTDMEVSSAYARPGLLEDIREVSIPQTISLNQGRITPYIVPAAILHSQKLQTFAAIGVDLHEVFRAARDASKKMEWLNKEAMRNQFGTHNIWPDIGIYLNDETAELRVLADYANVARPDVVVNIMEDPDWYNNGKLSIVKIQNKALKPRLGSYVVCRREVPEAATNEIQADLEAEQDLIAKQVEAGLPPEKRLQASPPIHLLNAGYDRSKLEPIISEIARSRTGLNAVSS